MKCYCHILGERDYSLFETVHTGLRLPAVLSNFGPVVSASVSNCAAVQQRLPPNALGDVRVTHLSKVGQFDSRKSYKFARGVHLGALRNFSLYAFFRRFHVDKDTLRRRDRENIIAMNGTGWPTEAQRSHANPAQYARRTLFGVLPLPRPSWNRVLKEHFHNNWPLFLQTFCHDPLSVWCPPWIRLNYESQNTH